MLRKADPLADLLAESVPPALQPLKKLDDISQMALHMPTSDSLDDAERSAPGYGLSESSLVSVKASPSAAIDGYRDQPALSRAKFIFHAAGHCHKLDR